MNSYWRDRCRRVINKVDEALPKEATIKERRAALRKVAGEFYCEGTSWPSQVWQQERRKYLAHHGERPTDQPPGRLLAAMESGDITFPFRGESDGTGVPDR
jgi:hypothetical protein